MKKKLFLAAAFLALATVVFVACKKEDNSGISVGYAKDKGTGANPNVVNSTTGSTTTASTT